MKRKRSNNTARIIFVFALAVIIASAFRPFKVLTTFSFTAIPFSSNDILAPGRGVNTWYYQHEWPADNTITMTVYPSTVITHGWDSYVRINWAQIELAGSGTTPAGAGRFHHEVMDGAIKWNIERGMKLSFGILPMAEAYAPYGSPGGAGLSYPTWLHGAMQALPANERDYIGGSAWVPNWNSATYLNAHDTLMGSIAAFIAGGSYTPSGGPKAGTLVHYRDVIQRIDIRGYGNFGEWHMSGLGTPPAGRAATEATLKAIVNQHSAKFPRYKLSMIMNAMSASTNSFTWWVLNGSGEAQNNVGRYGIRRDNVGQPIFNLDMECNPRSHNPGSGTVTAQSQINELWKTAPVDGEPSRNGNDVTVPSDPNHIYWTGPPPGANKWCGPCSQGSKNSGYCTFPSIPTYFFGDYPREVRDQHISSVGNGNYDPGVSLSTGQDSIRMASKWMGYRLILTGGSMTTTLLQNTNFNISLDWRNTGVAPNYEAWDIIYQLRTSADVVVGSWTSAYDVRTLLPSGASTTISENFNLGAIAIGSTYKFVMIIKDSANYRQPLPLAISLPARNSDGSHTLATNVEVGAGGGGAPGTVTQKTKYKQMIIRQ